MTLEHLNLRGTLKNIEPSIKDEDPQQDDGLALQESRQQNVGELGFDEYTSGGLGRHLGILSTTFLVCVPQ